MERKTNADSNIVYSMGESHFVKNRLISQAIESSSPTNYMDSETENEVR